MTLICGGVKLLISDIRESLGMSPEYPLMCTLTVYLDQWMMFLSPWIVTAICLERVIAVWKPHLVKQIFDLKRIMAFLVALLIIPAAIYVHLFFTDKLTGNALCRREYSFFSSLGYTFVKESLKTAIPAIIMMVSSILIVIKILESVRMRASSTIQAIDRSHIQTSITVVSVAVVFFILMVPTRIIFQIITINHTKMPFLVFVQDSKELSKIQFEFILKQVAEFMHLINYSTNFLLYLFTGHKFRKEFLQIVTKCCQREE